MCNNHTLAGDYVFLRENVIAGGIFNNYWMRLSGISRIIEAEVGGYLPKPQANRGLNNPLYPRKPNSIIILLFTWTIIKIMI